MAETVDGKKEEADYKRLHSFPLIRVSVAVTFITQTAPLSFQSMTF